MSDNEGRDKQALVPLESQIIEQILEAEDAQPLIVARLEALGSDEEDPEFRLFLRSTWDFLEGIRVIKDEQNFLQAKELEDTAAAGFRQLKIEELASISEGFSLFSSAIIEARNLNLNRALTLFGETEEYLKNAGRFGRKYEWLIDHIKPDSLFLGVIPALLAGDVDSARALVKQASAMAERVAEKYHPEGSTTRYMLLGFAQYYRAFFSFFQAQSDLSNLELDKLVAEDIASSARAAERFLMQADSGNKTVEIALHISRALIELSEVTKQLALYLHLCFKAAFKPDLQKFLDLKERVRRAIDHASNAGPQAISLVRSCNLLLTRIHNLERLAKPRKADFGIYSGLISSALFIPLLVIVAWANSTFATGLDGATLFTSVLILALIGGFGFGALRFKSLFLPSKDDSK